MTETVDPIAVRGLPSRPIYIKQSSIKLQRHMALLLAAQHGQPADRSLMIPLLAQHLKEQGGDIYEAFIKTAKRINGRKPEKVPVCQSTLVNKLCLAQIFKPGDQQSLCNIM